MTQSTAKILVSDSPRPVFRVGRWYRNAVTGVCLALCGLLYLFSLGLQQGGPQLAPVRSAFWAAIALVLAVLFVHLIFCRRHELVLGDERIMSQGLLSFTEIRLDDVTELKWRAAVPGVVDLTTNFEKVRILFSRYPHESCLPITEYLRDALPQSIQHDWNVFCLKVALPLRTGRRRIEVVRPRGYFDRL